MSVGSLVHELFEGVLRVENIQSCPKNADVGFLNEEVLMRLEGEMTSYVCVDSIDDGTAEDSHNYPIKFLNGLEPAGMPPHKLNLMIGAIIMLFRNLNTR